MKRNTPNGSRAHPTAFLKALYNLRRFSYKSITPNLLYQLHSTQPSKSKVIPLYYINIYTSIIFNHLPSELHPSQTIQDSPNRAWIRHRHLGTPEGAGGWPRRLASRPPQPPQRSQFEVHGGAGAQRAAARAEKPWVLRVELVVSFSTFPISQVFSHVPKFHSPFPRCLSISVFLTDLENGRMKLVNVGSMWVYGKANNFACLWVG